jgi:hypothetical protein
MCVCGCGCCLLRVSCWRTCEICSGPESHGWQVPAAVPFDERLVRSRRKWLFICFPIDWCGAAAIQGLLDSFRHHGNMLIARLLCYSFAIQKMLLILAQVLHRTLDIDKQRINAANVFGIDLFRLHQPSNQSAQINNFSTFYAE